MATDVGKLLNDLIVSVLGGPGGDPDFYHHQAAARAFVALKLLKLPIENEEPRRCGLRGISFPKEYELEDRGKGGNVFNFDFLAEAGWPPDMDTQEGS